MPDTPNRSLNHLRVDRFFEARDYRAPRRSFPGRHPQRNRGAHGAALWAEWSPLAEEFHAAEVAVQSMEHVREMGLVFEIETAPDARIDPAELEKERFGLQLLNIQRERRPVSLGTPLASVDDELIAVPPSPSQRTQTVERQVWFVPNGQLLNFERLLLTYAGSLEGSAPRTLVDCIERIGPVAFEQLWTDFISPPLPGETAWFEVWLRAPSETARDLIVRQFRIEAARLNLQVGEAELRLRDHTVVMARGTREQLSGSAALLSCIAEIRAGRDFCEFIQELPAVEQAAWGNDLLSRLDVPDDSISICVLDTGVNRNPLLAPLFAEGDAHTIKVAWGRGDDFGGRRLRQGGHGTPLAGIALYRDIAAAVGSRTRIQPPAILESAKIVPPAPIGDQHEERHAAAFTAQGVALVESFHAHRRRIYCLATCWDGPTDGRPSAWSALLDRLAVGEDREDRFKRLLIVAGGNVPQSRWANYPASNRDESCRIPAQTWNALVVGAFTAKMESPTSPTAGHEIARSGGLAPSSATSLSWGDGAMWPYRPDVVFEGGNANLPPGAGGPDMPPELLPLSTAAGFHETWFTSFHATSAAAPAAAHLAAQLMRAYPDYWPETIRALIVHSARWTDVMWGAVPNQLSPRAALKHLLRTVGYGVPHDLLALTSAPSRVTLVAQGELQPFRTEGVKVIPHQMHVYELPWPQLGLLELGQNIFGGADNVRLRVTLSYFIEPNPGERGYGSAYRYSSVQLRFRVNQPGQNQEQMLATIQDEVAGDASNDGAENEEGGASRGSNPSRRWKLGVNGRTRGSLHSDFWEGPASELAEMRHLVVYPITGWWRSRPSAGAGDSRLRYSLVVSIEADNESTDLYAEIETQIAVPVSAT